MEQFIRKKEKLTNNLIFQVLTWEGFDELSDPDDEESIKLYKICMFGVDEEDRSVCLKVDSYTPFYYIRIPDELQNKWNSFHTNVLKSYIENKLKYTKRSDDQEQSLKDSLKSILVCDKINIKGFTNDTKEKYVRLTFKNFESYNKSKYFFYPTVWNPVGNQKKGDLDYNKLPLLTQICSNKLKFDIFEHNIEPFIRFSHVQNIKMAGWVIVDNKYLSDNEEYSRCQLSYSCNYNRVLPLDKQTISNFVNCSFDIECTSESKKGFPDFHKKNDSITQIGATFIKYNGEELKYIATRKSPIEGGCDNVNNADVVDIAKNEMDIINKWVSFVEKMDPDIITGFNTYDFDWTYLYQRCALFNKIHLLERLSRISDIGAFYKAERLSTSAYGDNNFKFMYIYGVTNFDLRVLIKREHNLESYKLNNIAKHFNKEEKFDLSPHELFNKVEGTNKDMAEVCEYCIQDTVLVGNLFRKLCIFSNIIGMANISRVPITYVEIKGQQIKTFSQLLYTARENGYIVPTIPYNTTSSDTFTGATVLTAKKGAYYDPIAGLDFASLYPSIMIANNYCYTTIVEDDEKYGNIEGIEYKIINWTDEYGKEYNVKFVQNKQGLLPKMLDTLWKERKAIKKLMKTDDKSMYDIYNGQQLAIKVTMNSIYGFTGATFGRLPDKRIASAVTAIGRHSIEISKNYAEKHYDCEVIYGDTDSIYVKFNTPYEGKKHMEEVFRISQECADTITKNLFKYPMELEFEKVMYPFKLFTKKRYACVIWTNPDTYDYIDYKGIQIKRRDSCNYVKEEGMKIFETLLTKDIYSFKFGINNENVDMAIDIAKKAINNLLNGCVNVEKLIVSKAFREGYSYENKAICPECDKTWYKLDINNKKNMVIDKSLLKNESICPNCSKSVIFKKMLPNLPHVALAHKMEERDPFNCPIIGDRVPYIFIKGDLKAKQFEKVEDPVYAINNMLSIDYYYYFEHQLKSILETIFEIEIEDLSIIFEEAQQFNPKPVRKRTTKKTE